MRLAICRSPSGRRRPGLWAVVSAEVACQLLPFDEQSRRTAMRTSDGVLGGLEVGQKAPLLGDVEHVAELHRRMTGQGRGSLFDRAIAAAVGERGKRLLDRRRRST